MQAVLRLQNNRDVDIWDVPLLFQLSEHIDLNIRALEFVWTENIEYKQTNKLKPRQHQTQPTTGKAKKKHKWKQRRTFQIRYTCGCFDPKDTILAKFILSETFLKGK
jgi:hypothetical protein